MFSRVILIFLACLVIGLHSSAAEFSSIVAFGDSTSDFGNGAPVFDTIPYPSKYPMQPWVKQFATMLNITSFSASGNDKFTGGTDYAFSGTTTKYISDKGWNWVGKFVMERNLTDQISNRYLGKFNTDGVKTGPETLHTIWIGLNDLVLAYNDKQQIKEKWSRIDEISVEVARSIEGQIQALSSAGVKNILWLNLPDPSKFPGIIFQKLADGTGLKALSGASQAFNKEMDAAIQRLKSANPSLNLIKLDVAKQFDEILKNPSSFGFKNVSSSGFGDSDLFFFDGVHLTPHGNHVLAKFAFDSIKANEQKTK